MRIIRVAVVFGKGRRRTSSSSKQLSFVLGLNHHPRSSSSSKSKSSSSSSSSSNSSSSSSSSQINSSSKQPVRICHHRLTLDGLRTLSSGLVNRVSYSPPRDATIASASPTVQFDSGSK